MLCIETVMSQESICIVEWPPPKISILITLQKYGFSLNNLIIWVLNYIRKEILRGQPLMIWVWGRRKSRKTNNSIIGNYFIFNFSSAPPQIINGRPLRATTWESVPTLRRFHFAILSHFLNKPLFGVGQRTRTCNIELHVFVHMLLSQCVLLCNTSLE